MLTVGLIGCGGMGAMHANCYLALADKVKIVAIADKCPEKAKDFAEKTGAKIYTSGKELLENETPDIIDICLPTYLHTEHAVAAMEKGCNVFLEKPVCLNEDEAKLLLETEKKTGVKVQVGQVVRFNKFHNYLKDALDAGTYGKLVSASFTRLSVNPKWSWENWYNDPEKSGTVALDLHVHDVDIMRYLMGGDPDTVSSRATRNKDGAIQQIFTVCTYGDAVVTTEGCWDYPDGFPFFSGFRAKLEKATMICEYGKLTVYTEDGKSFEAEFPNETDMKVDVGINVSSLGGYLKEIKYFVEEIIGGNGKEIAPLCEGVASARLAWKEIKLAGGKVLK